MTESLKRRVQKLKKQLNVDPDQPTLCVIFSTTLLSDVEIEKVRQEGRIFKGDDGHERFRIHFSGPLPPSKKITEVSM